MKRTNRILKTVLCITLVIGIMIPILSLASAQDGWTVTFDSNGGSFVPSAVVDNGRLVRMPETPDKHGYVFVHWFTENSFESPRWDFARNRVTGDVTLYAMWAEVETYDWVMKYHETFEEPFNEPDEWILDDYSNESCPIWGQNGLGFIDRERRFRNPDPGLNVPAGNLFDFSAWIGRINEFRKSHTYGQDGWLTIEQYGRNDTPGATEPNFGGRFVAENGRAVIQTYYHTDAAIITNTEALPPVYRVEVTVSNIDAGGLRIDPETGREVPLAANNRNPAPDWTIDGKFNGYNIPSWGGGGANTPYFMSAGPWRVNNNNSSITDAGWENGMYFLSIGTYANPKPNNNVFIHHHRKICMDVDNNHSVGGAPWSSVWDPNTETHRPDGSRYISMLWLDGRSRDPMSQTSPNGYNSWFHTGNPFYSYTQVGSATGSRMVDKYLPNESYVFAVERTPEYFTLSITGNFFHGGQTTYSHTKFHLPDNDPTSPRYNGGLSTWKFNQTPEELGDWVPPNDVVEFKDLDGNILLVHDTWTTDSYNPCFFWFGIPHINFYSGHAEFSDVKLFVVKEYLSAENAKFVSIVETAKNSRIWELTFSVDWNINDGSKETVFYTIRLNGNNANLDGRFVFPVDHELAGYTLTYDIKGNGSNIKAFALR